MGSPIGVSTRVPVIGTISVSNGTRRGYEPHLVCTEAIIMASTATATDIDNYRQNW